jgi:hypothetical protein
MSMRAPDGVRGVRFSLDCGYAPVEAAARCLKGASKVWREHACEHSSARGSCQEGLRHEVPRLADTAVESLQGRNSRVEPVRWHHLWSVFSKKVGQRPSMSALHCEYHRYPQLDGNVLCNGFDHDASLLYNHAKHAPATDPVTNPYASPMMLPT